MRYDDGRIGRAGLAMNVTKCEIPSASVLDLDAIKNAQFHDCYRVRLARLDLGIVDIFFAVFGYRPLWIKLLLVVRNVVARRTGLETPTVAEIMSPEIRACYRVGDKIGPWPIFSIGDSEIIAGRNNRHLDFRLSVLKHIDGDRGSVFVSTVCNVHNIYGKIYLWFIAPFHRSGMRLLMSNAVAAKRL
jgi:Protein of unknown function (DUF2867)